MSGHPDYNPHAPHDPEFGVDPEDSARLLELRDAIDTHLEWESRKAQEAGDYVGAILYAGQRLLRLTAKVHRQRVELRRFNREALARAEGHSAERKKVSAP